MIRKVERKEYIDVPEIYRDSIGDDDTSPYVEHTGEFVSCNSGFWDGGTSNVIDDKTKKIVKVLNSDLIFLND